MTATRIPRHPSMSSVTSKGQVTIPAHIRHALGIKPHDRVMFVVKGGRVEIAPAESVVARTKGILKTDMPRLSIQEAKIAFEEAMAEEGMQSLNRGR